MLSKKYRAPVQKFPRGAKTSYSGKVFIVKEAKNNLPHSRVGVIVSKGVAKNATDRNKIKRMVIDAFRESPFLLKKPGLDHLVILNSSDKLDVVDYHSGLSDELGTAISKFSK